MNNILSFFLLALTVLILTLGCGDDTDIAPDPITPLSVRVNGAELRNGDVEVPVNAEITMTFPAALDPGRFQEAFDLSAIDDTPTVSFSFANQSSRVIITATLAFGTTYTLRVSTDPIGQNGERLASDILLSFTTAEDEVERAPCVSASADCLRTIDLSGDGNDDFSFYASFPIHEEDTRWENITSAIVVIHGVNRNGDDYFNYLMDVISAEGLAEEVVVIAPVFKNESEANSQEFAWAGSGWREGRNTTSGDGEISSFRVVDQLINQLSDNSNFPVLAQIMVTGHSSGALFSHLYAGANAVEEEMMGIDFRYLVANSQYFYYPDGQRVNENTNELYTPTGCTGYDFWPLGYEIVPPYLASVSTLTYNERFLSRDVVYLLGNGDAPDPSLNTEDCNATLLGPTRFARGERMLRYLDLKYPGEDIHRGSIVEGVGHEGRRMYASPEFRTELGLFLAE